MAVLLLGAALVVAGALFASQGVLLVPEECRLPRPPVPLRVASSPDEVAFFVDFAPGAPQYAVTDLRYELAIYSPGDDWITGPGTVIQSGDLGSLGSAGEFQFHDMAAAGELSPGNDFFLLLNPPEAALQLRLLGMDGERIAGNAIGGCA